MAVLRVTFDDVDALSADGRVIHIRELGRSDISAMQALHDQASDRSIYFRFFALSRTGIRKHLETFSDDDSSGFALGAFVHETQVGMGAVVPIDAESAEIALLVLDGEQHGGIGTLLLEHLVGLARGRGIARFVGEVLASNAPMLDVLHNLGFATTSQSSDGQMHVEFVLDVADQVVTAISEREQSAGAASLRPVLAPTSVAVIGAGQRSGAVGHEVLRNILDAGFTGTVYVVNPNRRAVLGVPCLSSPADLPDAVDLAIVALPADKVLEAVRACGERGVRAAVLLGAGFGESGARGAALQDAVLDVARRWGMRLVGPNCIGVLNTDPAVRLDATFGRLTRRAGPLAVLAQSGAFGVGLLAAAGNVGLGVSQFISVGNKIDIGGNDLLLAWAHDRRTRVIGGYFESIGDPRRFARIARRVACSKPILVMKSGRTEVGKQAGRSHTAAAASSDTAIDALFHASGVLRVRTTRELLNAARLLCDLPLPGGPRVAIVGNSGGPEILAADAASDSGLVVPQFDTAARAALQAIDVPTSNPLDLGAAVQAGTVRAVLHAVAATPSVDAVLTVFTGIAIADADEITIAVAAVAAESEKPFVAVAVGEPETTVPLPGTARKLPVFAFPEEAAAALGLAWRYTQLRRLPALLPERPEGIDAAAARALVDDARRAGAEWLPLDTALRLLTHYGIPVCPYALVTDRAAALAAAQRLGYPIAAKAATAGLHKTEAGALRLNITSAGSLRAAITELLAQPGGAIVLQPMLSQGTELILGSVQDPQCGPLVMIGAGGVLTDILGDCAFGLAPLSARDADQLIDQLRSAPLFAGYRGAPMLSRPAIRDLLVRVAALADDIPDIAELDINPVIGSADGMSAVDARIRLADPPQHPDPLVRQLRQPRAVGRDTDRSRRRQAT